MILYITATLPALTVTFIYREIFRLQRSGFEVRCVSMNTPGADEISAEAEVLVASTTYLDQVSGLSKLGGFLACAAFHPTRLASCLGELFIARPMKGLRDYARLAYHLFEAGYLAWHLRHAGYRHIHCHFINGPTSIGMFLARLLDLPFSFTMHASMIWLDPIAFLNKLKACSFCASISQYNKNYVLETYGRQFDGKIRIVHCGIDPEGEPVPAPQRDSGAAVQLLGVGQLNRRKGFHVLLGACALLKDRGVAFHCNIVGGGEQRVVLEDLRDRLGLRQHVTLVGPVKHEVVRGYLSGADVFVLPCVISEDGWRDGIPVALMEAMFHRRPVISTNILGLPELIDDQVNGILVEPNDEAALAGAIETLSIDAELRSQMGERGRSKVLRDFNNLNSAQTLAGLFGAA